MRSGNERQLPKVIPTHVAIIMDGNGRWARKRGLPRLAGHQAGVDNLRRVIEAAVEFGVQYLTIYAFSTENWERPEGEVRGLIRILEDVIDRELMELHKNGVQLRHLGRLEGLSPTLVEKIGNAIKLTQDNSRLILNVAWNYGGRDEIIRAMQLMLEDDVDPTKIDEDLVRQYLYTVDSPDPDLIIRTSGEMRISNFLIWQSAYSEWFFTETYWPDFGAEDLLEALWVFAQRERRFGSVPEPIRTR
jgi:undecaprenyl diphosphate synthase